MFGENNFVNNGIHPDNSTAKQWMLVSRPCSRNTCTQQPTFPKSKKRQILLTITGRGHAIKKNPQNLATNKQQFKLEIIVYLNCL